MSRIRRPRTGPRLAFILALAPAGIHAVWAAPGPGGATLEPVAFADLPGWRSDDLSAAFAAFKAGCRVQAAVGTVDLRPSCAVAAALPPEAARPFFEGAFAPYRVQPAQPGGAAGFLTGYFEPEFEASPTRTPDFPVPALARPSDLVTLAPGETVPGLDPSLRAARRGPDGLTPYPDRAAIEDGALGTSAVPLLYLRDAVDLLVLQVQGSGRARLPDGRVLRVGYDGRNGRPYTAVARLMVVEGDVPLEGLTLARWTGWLKAHPARARELIRRNASYVFFKLAPLADATAGPVGAAGVALTAGRSLAVDSALWSYGLPFYLSGTVADAAGRPERLARLTVAQDTGSAIVGAARGDLFFGGGAAAGAAAAALRHAVTFTVLLPRRAMP